MDRGEHPVRYYGWYSSRSRRERKTMEPESTLLTLVPPEEPISRFTL